MARIKKDLVTARETEAIEAFQNGASVKDVNNALFAKYGKRMGLKRIYELRDGVRKAQTTETPTKAPTVVDAEVVASEAAAT